MNQRSSALARAIAVTALVGGFLVVVLIVAISLGGDEESGSDGRSRAAKTTKSDRGGGPGKARKSYVVQNGDTLTSIGHKTGVPVSQIEELNPGVDPQILVSGEKLKLR